LRLSPAARAAALRAGEPAEARQTWEIPAERKDLVAALLDAGVMPDVDGALRFDIQSQVAGDGRLLLADGKTSIELDQRPGDVAAAVQEAVRLLKLSTDLEEARERDLRAWVAANGSERLKALLAEGLRYQGVYRAERLALERPGWLPLAKLCGKVGDVANAEQSEIDVLRAERAKGVLDVRLVHLECGPRGGKESHQQTCPVKASHGQCASKSRSVLLCEFLGAQLVLEIPQARKG